MRIAICDDDPKASNSLYQDITKIAEEQLNTPQNTEPSLDPVMTRSDIFADPDELLFAIKDSICSADHCFLLQKASTMIWLSSISSLVISPGSDCPITCFGSTRISRSFSSPDTMITIWMFIMWITYIF